MRSEPSSRSPTRPPRVAAVQELAGLAAYRCGRWREAARHLTTFGELSDSTDHLPDLMDCQRALHKPKKVAELWTELRQRSPEPDVLAEGRIVAAASLAETGDLNGAIAMLATAGASKMLRNPSERHLRQWYLLADLYERAGDVPRAREYFERVLRADPDGLRRDRPAPRPRPRAPLRRRPAPHEEAQPLAPNPPNRPDARPATGRRRRGVVGVVAGVRGRGRGRRRGRRGGGGAVVVVVVVGGGAVPKLGPTTVTRVPIGVSGQTRAASA